MKSRHSTMSSTYLRATLGPNTAAELLALPISKMIDEKYRYLGSAPLTGDTVALAYDDDGVAWRQECRREHPHGPNIWVRVRVL